MTLTLDVIYDAFCYNIVGRQQVSQDGVFRLSHLSRCKQCLCNGWARVQRCACASRGTCLAVGSCQRPACTRFTVQAWLLLPRGCTERHHGCVTRGCVTAPLRLRYGSALAAAVAETSARREAGLRLLCTQETVNAPAVPRLLGLRPAS